MIQKFTMLLICATTLVASTKNTETIITPLPESPFETGHLPNGIAYSPNGKWLIVPCESDTFIYVYSVGSNGALQLIQKVPCLQSTGTAAYSPDGKYVSLTNLGRHIITTFSVALDGIITQVGSPINTNIFRPASIVYAPNGTFLAVQTEDYRNNIELFIVNQNGSLTSAQIFTKNGSDTISPRSLQFSPDSKYLAYSGSSGTVYVLTIDQQTGQVSNQRGFVAQGLASICSVAYSLNGNFLAAADNNNNNIALFTVHKIDGGLTLKETVAVIGDISSQNTVTFSPNNQFLAYAHAQNKQIFIYTVSTDGSLTQYGSPLETGIHPYIAPFSPIGVNGISYLSCANIFNQSISSWAFQLMPQMGPLVSTIRCKYLLNC